MYLYLSRFHFCLHTPFAIASDGFVFHLHQIYRVNTLTYLSTSRNRSRKYKKGYSPCFLDRSGNYSSQLVVGRENRICCTLQPIRIFLFWILLALWAKIRTVWDIICIQVGLCYKIGCIGNFHGYAHFCSPASHTNIIDSKWSITNLKRSTHIHHIHHTHTHTSHHRSITFIMYIT